MCNFLVKETWANRTNLYEEIIHTWRSGKNICLRTLVSITALLHDLVKCLCIAYCISGADLYRCMQCINATKFGWHTYVHVWVVHIIKKVVGYGTYGTTCAGNERMLVYAARCRVDVASAFTYNYELISKLNVWSNRKKRVLHCERDYGYIWTLRLHTGITSCYGIV